MSKEAFMLGNQDSMRTMCFAMANWTNPDNVEPEFLLVSFVMVGLAIYAAAWTRGFGKRAILQCLIHRSPCSICQRTKLWRRRVPTPLGTRPSIRFTSRLALPFALSRIRIQPAFFADVLFSLDFGLLLIFAHVREFLRARLQHRAILTAYVYGCQPC